MPKEDALASFRGGEVAYVPDYRTYVGADPEQSTKVPIPSRPRQERICTMKKVISG